MPIYIYYEPNQNDKVKLQYDNIIDRKGKNLTEDFESTDNISFYPFSLADDKYKNFTTHIFTSKNIENVLRFDCFDITLPYYGNLMKLFIERKNPNTEEKIIVDYNNGNEKHYKQFFAFTSSKWNKSLCSRFLKNEKAGDFFIELTREKFIIIKEKSRPSLYLEEQ